MEAQLWTTKVNSERIPRLSGGSLRSRRTAEALQAELIQFMFLRHSDGSLDIPNCLRLWFGKKNDTDIEIRNRFGDHVRTALQGGYDSWKKTPRGCLAL